MKVWFRHALMVVTALMMALSCVSGYPTPASAGAAPGHASHYKLGSRAGLVGPRAVYLALGDSLAFGYQPGLDWKHGYADDWFKDDLARKGTRRLENLGCAGETLATFMGQGACRLRTFRKVHYVGSQLSAALSFMRKNAGRVSPVTLDIGANDVLRYFNFRSCQIITPPAGISATLAHFDANLSAVLSQLKSALDAQGDLFVMNYYFPLQNACYKRLGGDTPAFRRLMGLVEGFNTHLTRDATVLGIRVADVFGAYGGAAAPNPQLCRYTWVCSGKRPGEAIHPSDEGYRVIYQTLRHLAGY